MKLMRNLFKAAIRPRKLEIGMLSCIERPTKRIMKGIKRLPPPIPPALQRIVIKKTINMPIISDPEGGITSSLKTYWLAKLIEVSSCISDRTVML